MNAEISQQLKEARQRLRAGERPAALALLKTILVQDRTHVEAWWLAAQAAPNRAEAEAALRVVLKLQPDHPHAGKALARLQAAGNGTAAPRTPPAEHPAASRPITAPPPRIAAAQNRGKRNRTRILAIILSMLVISASGSLFVLNLLGHPLAQQIASGLNPGPLPTATPAFIASGNQLQGIIQAGETLRYYFEGASGTDMFVGVGFAAVPSDANTDGALELFDPDGYRVTVSGGESIPFEVPTLPGLNTGNVSMLYQVLDMDGVWELRLIGREGRSAGAFVLLMQCLPERACTAPPPTWRASH